MAIPDHYGQEASRRAGPGGRPGSYRQQVGGLYIPVSYHLHCYIFFPLLLNPISHISTKFQLPYFTI